MDGQDLARRVIDIADSAADYDLSQERNAFIDQACSGDENLKRHVLDYLNSGITAAFGQKTISQQASAASQGITAAGEIEVTPGTRFGPYEIIALLGKGGMGQVFRARDTRLNRVVALKVSKTQFSQRFELEARAAAALNHPNICTLYDVGPNFLVMEYIEGAPLRGPLPLQQALRYASQICDSLDAAHRKGIVHRDLKPENILVTKSGAVKLLDFGLAKFGKLDDSSQLSTFTETLTGKHEIIGTLLYMSPEQLRNSEGQQIDARSDIFSFGLVLYEMISGRRAFQGTTPADIIAAILERPMPSTSALGPPELDRLLQRCLQKDREERWQTVRDLKAELEWMTASPSVAATALPRSVPGRISRLAPWTLSAAAALGLLWVSLRAPTGTAPRPVTRTTLSTANNTFVAPVLSRDGTRLLYAQIQLPPRLWLRMMDHLDGQPIPGTEGAEGATFSPDGQTIAFVKGPAPFRLAKIPASGGSATFLSDAANFVGAPYWADDGSIWIGSSQGLLRVPAAGGRIETVTVPDRSKGESGHFEPVLLPGGRALLFTLSLGSSPDSTRDNGRIAVLDLKSRAYQLLPNSGWTPSYAPTGHLLYRRGPILFAAPFDLKKLRVTGNEVAVVDGLSTGLVTGTVPYTLSPFGQLVYRSGNESKETMALAWVDRKGAVEMLPEPPHPWQTVPLSPDGRKISGALPDTGANTETARIWTYDFDRGILSPLTSGALGVDFAAIWSPDGRFVTFSSNRKGQFGIYRIAIDSSRPAELLLATPSLAYPTSWTPDSKALVYHELDQAQARLMVLPLQPDGKAGVPSRLHPDEPSSELQGVLSPDGKWLAYSSKHSGRFEVYISSFPGAGGRYQVSTKGGRLPKWSPNGRELFYVELGPRRLMAAEISMKPSFEVATPRPLFTLRQDSGDVYYNVSPDGKRFLALTPPQSAGTAPSPNTFVMVTDWFEELARRVR